MDYLNACRWITLRNIARGVLFQCLSMTVNGTSVFLGHRFRAVGRTLRALPNTTNIYIYHIYIYIYIYVLYIFNFGSYLLCLQGVSSDYKQDKRRVYPIVRRPTPSLPREIPHHFYLDPRVHWRLNYLFE